MNKENTSKVRELMLEALPQKEVGAEKQSIRGSYNNHNILVGNHSSVTVVGRQPHNGPELVQCHVCGQLVSWTADVCPVCFDNLEWRRQVAYEQKQKTTYLKIFAGVCIYATVYYWTGELFPAISEYATWLATIATAPMAAWAMWDWM